MASSSSNSASGQGQILKRANPSTIQDKFLVGYQGWFTCAGDGEPVGPGHHGWLHWFDYPIPDGGRPNTDVWPDISSYSPSELYPAPGLKTTSGEPVFLFSSRNAKTVQRHFHWMAEHGVDGAFLQRFAGQCDLEAGNEGIMRIRDEVGDRVREAAEREGRVFAIMYDVSGVAADRIQRILERDWAHLVRNKGILDSPNYLKEKGKPVVALWGFGFDNANHTPELVHSITQFFRNTTPGGVYLMGGAPSNWRTADSDADRNPAFLDVWLNDFDAISPWTVGRYNNDQEADGFFEGRMKVDWEIIKKRNDEGGGARKVDYIPVVLPGGSGYNLSQGKWGFNNIKRNGGRFLWKQITNAKRLGVRTMYGAMWDEYDEGTAFMPIVEHKRNLPVSDKYRFMALDEDGYDIPSDWYMRICGFAGEGLRSERRIHDTFPVKELQDYWSSRPRYEQVSQKSGDFISGSSSSSTGVGGGSGAGGSRGTGTDADGGQTYQEWLAAQKEEKEEAPPPPYTLEAAEPAPSPTATTNSGGGGNAPVQVSNVGSTSVAQVSPAAMATSIGRDQQPNVVASGPGTNISGYAGQSSSPAPASGSSAAYLGANVNASAANSAGAYQQQPPQQHQFQQHTQQDPIASLAHGLERQNISDPGYPSGGPVGVNTPVGGTAPSGASSPIYNNIPPHEAGDHHGRQSTLPRHDSLSRPGQVPQSHTAAPQSHGYHNIQAVSGSIGHTQPGHAQPPQIPPRQGTATSPVGSQTTQNQAWPPAEWNVTGPRPTTSPGPHSPPPSVPHSSYHGGANLSRPSSYSASSNTPTSGAGGANLRPSSTLSGRPSSAAATSPYANPQISNLGSNSYNQSPYAPQNVSAYPPPRPSSAVPHPHSQGSGYGFPSVPTSPTSSSYNTGPPSMSTYPGQGGSTNQGGYAAGNLSQAMHGSSYAWSTRPGSSSPPHSPPAGIGGSAFPTPAQSTYPANPPRPYNPVSQGPVHQQQQPYSSGPSFPSANPTSIYPSSQDIAFPQAQAGGPPGTEGSYFGEAASSAYSYPGQYGASSPPGSMAFPGGPGPSGPPYGYPQPVPAPAGGPWAPPPRPPVHSGTMSYGKPSSSSTAGPSFPSSSGSSSGGALGFAMNAVDKVAGKKTREQLEREVGNLAQTGTKLFNKYLK